MLMCQKDKSAYFHRRLLECIDQGLNYEAQGILEKTENLSLCDGADDSVTSLLHYCVQSGNAVLVKVLAEKGCKIDVHDASGMTPLILAVQKGHVSVVEILLKIDADIYVTDSDEINALQHSCDIIIDIFTTDFIAQLLRYSYEERVNHVLILEMIIERINADFFAKKEANMKFLLNASDEIKLAIVAFCDVEVALFILHNDFSIEFREPKLGLTALHCASILGKLENAKLLIENRAEIEALSKTNLTPLMLAVENAKAPIVELLLKNNADIYTTDSNGLCAFQRSFYVNINLIKLPVAKFLNSAYKVRESHEHILEMFIDKINQDFLINEEATAILLLNANSLVKLAVLASCNTKLASFILENNFPIEFREPRFGLTALHCAGILGRFENSKHLIERKTNVDTKDKTGFTPLMLAIKRGYVSVIELLLKNNADIFATDLDGVSALQLSLYINFREHSSVVFLNFSMREKQRPVFYMVMKKVNERFLTDKETTMKLLINCSFIEKLAIVASCNTEVASFILQNNYDVEFCEPVRGFTALHCSVFLGIHENVKFLIERGANINTLDKSKHSPLRHYTQHLQYVDTSLELLKVFLDRSITLDIVDNFEITDIHHLLQEGIKEIVKEIFKSSIDIAAAVTSRPLQYVLMGNRHLKVTDIIELGISIDVNLCDPRTNYSALMTEIYNGDVEKSEYLLDNGADANYTCSKYNTTALSIAMVTSYSKNMHNITELLLQRGIGEISDICNYLKYLLQHPQKELRPIKPLVAHLAIRIALDPSALTESTRDSINLSLKYKRYFDLCSRQLEELKKVVLDETVTMFDLLYLEEKTLLIYARNENFMQAYKTSMEKILHSESHYLDILQKRFKKTIDKVKVKKAASSTIEASSGYYCILM